MCYLEADKSSKLHRDKVTDWLAAWPSDWERTEHPIARDPAG
jgi:hypothetical protein